MRRRAGHALLGAAALATTTAAAVAAAGSIPGVAAHHDPAEGTTPLDLVQARVGQQRTDLHVDLRTAKPIDTTTLVPGSGRSLCVVLLLAGDAARTERLCAVTDDTAPSGLRLRLTRLTAAGGVASIAALQAPVSRPDERTVVADVPVAKLHLRPGPSAWRAESGWRDGSACAPHAPTVAACTDTLPDHGTLPLPIVATAPTGCVFSGPREVRGGDPAGGRRIALTFDDGPADDTARFLDVLERAHVPATFFVVGRYVPGREAVLRRMLADGDMIANHSYSHADLGGGGPAADEELRRTQEAVRAATGFTPCLFRPPYGSTSPALVAAAAAQHLTSVLWDDDPQDWRQPGADAIRRTVLAEAHPGAIVISHDGGGPREQTLAALPAEIRDLTARGYRFVTVNDLLGLPVTTR